MEHAATCGIMPSSFHASAGETLGRWWHPRKLQSVLFSILNQIGDFGRFAEQHIINSM
jgi:hypothetical protein